MVEFFEEGGKAEREEDIVITYVSLSCSLDSTLLPPEDELDLHKQSPWRHHKDELSHLRPRPRWILVRAQHRLTSQEYSCVRQDDSSV